MSIITLRQQAYQCIQGGILSGRMRAGSLVSELSLAKEIGIGRTPVREAIQQLQFEGLLEQVPRRGTIVRPPQRRDIVELCQLREALECYAVGLAAHEITPADLTTLGKLCNKGLSIARELKDAGKEFLDESMMGQYLADDMAFHMVLVRAAGNRRILKSVADSRVLTRLFGTGYTQPDLHAVTYTYISHRRILAAVRRSDAEAARQLMTHHIHGSSRVTLECYDQMHARANVNRPASTGPLEGLMKQLNQIEESLGMDVSE